MKISFHGADLGVTGSCHLEEAEWHARKHARHGHGKKGKEAVPLYTVLFCGDLGYSGRVILRDPAPPPKADIVIMETTYGDRLHKTLQPSIEELYEAVTDTFRRGGSVIIPTFALERAQEILHYLRAGVEGKSLPASMQVFLDSPMAISATEIFRRHPECYDEEASDRFRHGQPSTPLADSLLMQTGHPERIFLVRGEEETTQTFSQQLTDTQVIMPKLHEEFTL